MQCHSLGLHCLPKYLFPVPRMKRSSIPIVDMCVYTVFLHMNDDVVNVQTELILFRLPCILVGSLNGPI